jgi:hypothetical protein
VLEVADAGGGLRALQARVLVGTLAHALAAQLRERAPGAREDGRIGVGVPGGEPLQLVHEHELEVVPFAHDLALLVALLPAVPAVAGGTVALVRSGLDAGGEIARAQSLLERLEHLGNVVVELCARQRRGGRELRIGVRRRAPLLEQGVAPGGEVSRHRVRVCPARRLSHSHRLSG